MWLGHPQCSIHQTGCVADYPGGGPCTPLVKLGTLWHCGGCGGVAVLSPSTCLAQGVREGNLLLPPAACGVRESGTP